MAEVGFDILCHEASKFAHYEWRDVVRIYMPSVTSRDYICFCGDFFFPVYHCGFRHTWTLFLRCVLSAHFFLHISGPILGGSTARTCKLCIVLANNGLEHHRHKVLDRVQCFRAISLWELIPTWIMKHVQTWTLYQLRALLFNILLCTVRCTPERISFNEYLCGTPSTIEMSIFVSCMMFQLHPLAFQGFFVGSFVQLGFSDGHRVLLVGLGCSGAPFFVSFLPFGMHGVCQCFYFSHLALPLDQLLK